MPAVPTDFENFARLCASNDIKLHESVLTAGLEGLSSLVHTYEPDGMYAAVAEAGQLFRRKPENKSYNTRLASAAISREVLYGFPHSLASRTLVGMVNASIAPVRARSWDTGFSCRNVQVADVCRAAETYFGAAIVQILQPRERIEGYNHIVGHQIIVGEGDKIIAMRKGAYAPTALTFEQITINGIPYPAGSIVKLHLLDQFRNGKYHRRPPAARQVVGVERVSHIGFRRLSAFALPPSQRRVVFPGVVNKARTISGDYGRRNVSEYDIVSGWSLSRIRCLMSSVVERHRSAGKI